MSEAEPLALSSGPYMDMDATGGPRLIASECRACHHRLFPTAAVCPNCMSEDMAPLPLSREGKVYSFTVLRQSPPGFDNPSVIAYIDMPEGVRIFTHLDMAPEEAACEKPVVLKQVEPKMDRYGRKVLRFKFAPIREAGR